ncbi:MULTISPECIES: protein-L-isoaspartate O-methyltransferase family protein [unclassified Ornithinimicrobium]|uniref:protein-L-isoaspartate O-methyltransferase family protein n=1 Tax=unclassified Ornithinimicrobium TaxID=2615080 RepID=UPI00385201E8
MRHADRTSAQRRVEDAMAATPRSAYLPPGQRWAADHDEPLRIGHGATCSQPTTVRTMLSLLDVREGQRVLDVGSGSGWTTAILARLVGTTGSVLGVEIVPELVEDAAARLRRDKLGHAAVRVPDADVVGAPDAGPFDRILVSAMAQTLPEQLVEQLAPDGLMVLPLDGRVVRVTVEDNVPRVDPAPGWYRFVPLLGS